MPFNRPSFPIKKRQGANLPHWTADHATYFVTFRLVDSLPQKVIAAYKRERDRLLAALRGQRGVEDALGSRVLSPGDLQRLHHLFSEKIESYLDAGEGSCWLKLPHIAKLVQDALLFFHTERYTLHAWAIMPNHVHAVFRPHHGNDLSQILHSWKSFTAKEADKFLKRSGEFWQSEPYDHLIRDAADFLHCIDYTLQNPRKAGLLNWPWAGETTKHRRDADAT